MIVVMPAAWLYHRVLLDVSRSTGLAPHAITGPTRTSRIVAARHAVWWLLHELAGLKATAIGHLVGRHHSTVIAALRRPSASVWEVVLEVLESGGCEARP